ncbi:cytochrome c oxidase accessory protein CcoG [Octadecabacter sp. 1_MG-2023]|uniref:cytochrome c oxidase accessory protein CcoG n=1 Tax=unclassified Octadecabacter TaxID=196158 RepID=UPI001C096F42|nr:MULTISPECIES: cytochrome c oxidase accessory protein CcoG [unclassified Octadecabacter]MBU2992484.1 cytochrome c oxidase accessory protein CcoG [Octadecabacter sp. B2R22]MDO6734759.1 cytochrome c oxidase accessory protein CcoG [Octadecabacter sp. 1_MG-2023]
MSTENPPSLYAKREPVFPRKVKGTFRTLKWAIMAVTLGIYYLTPWIRWDRGAELPDQAVLIDLAHRRFFFFWIEIWPHEFYFIAGLLIMAGLGLFLFTSAMGRVWCGYTCPQTVWTDLFIATERWIEGDRNARVRLWNAKWDGRKVRLRVTKYFTWLLIGLATGGAWVFYFTDAPTLFTNLLNGSAHPIAYTTMAVLAVTTVFFGGIAREQVCIYACPWPRIQAAMMDEDTITIGYREWRGEPRKHSEALKTGEPMGDCIDCKACVTVCPMGIDIRDGQQMACITCGLCIDACDDMMAKIGKPRGLVDYLSLDDAEAEAAGKPTKPVWQHILRPRTLIYSTLWSIVGIGLVVALFIRTDIDMTVAPVRNPVYVTLSDGTIRNVYEVRLRNKHGEERPFELSLNSEAPLLVSLQGQEEGDLTVMVPADSTHLVRVFVSAEQGSEGALGDRTPLRFWIEDSINEERAFDDTYFNGTGGS